MNKVWIALGTLALLGIGCGSEFEMGTLPTATQLAAMDEAQKSAAMQAAAVTHPLAPLTEGEKTAEANIMRQILKMGVPEKFLSWTGTGTRKASGSARFVRQGEQWAVIFDETFSVEAAPGLTVAVRKKGTVPSAAALASGDLLDLGLLLALQGPQAYEVPSGTVMALYPEAVIYAKSFWTAVAQTATP
jgi:hypothetical protein